MDTNKDSNLFSYVSEYVSLFDWGCLFFNAAWLLLSLSHVMGGQLNLASLLNRSMAGLGNPMLLGVYPFKNKDIYIYHH